MRRTAPSRGNLCEGTPVTDAVVKAARHWLAGLELPLDERLTLDGCVRQVDFLDDRGLARDIARQALAWPEVLRLMNRAGGECADGPTFMASIGDIGRSPPRKLVS